MAQPVLSIKVAKRPDAVKTKNIIVTRLPTPDGNVENMDVARESAEPKAAINAQISAAIPVCIPLKQSRIKTTTAKTTKNADTATLVNNFEYLLFILSVPEPLGAARCGGLFQS
jgi:hypothetical protein